MRELNQAEIEVVTGGAGGAIAETGELIGSKLGNLVDKLTHFIPGTITAKESLGNLGWSIGRIAENALGGAGKFVLGLFDGLNFF